MSRDCIPFFLHEAIVSLYPAAADGSSLTGLAIWSGALANKMSVRSALEELKVMGSGAAYATANHIDEEHIIDIARSWILRRSALADFFPVRNQQYVMEVVWMEENVDAVLGQAWYKRTFYGVTGRAINHDSLGTNQFVVNQTFRAQHFVEINGTTGAAVYTPTPQFGQSVGFFREEPFVNGTYLLGNYRWPQNMALGTVAFEGLSGQGAATVLTLEVAGTLTSQTVTIPAGLPNVPVIVSVSLNGYIVPADSSVRWKITSGPSLPENAMWLAALSLQATPPTQPTQVAGFFLEEPFVVGEYLNGEFWWPQAVALGLADLEGVYGQGAATVLTLEVGGVLTANTITIPAGTANTPVEAELNLNGLIIPPNTSVRWKITAGPALPENGMWVTSLSLQVTPQS